MGEITAKIDAAFRDYVTDGVPASGPNDPVKAEIRLAGRAIDSAVTQLAGAIIADSAILVYAARSSLYANLTPIDRSLGVVYNDGVNNGVYVKTGATGTGSWTLTGLLAAGPSGKSLYQSALDTGAISSGTDEASFVASALAPDIDPAVLPLQDYFRPNRVKVGFPEAGTIFTGGTYDDFRYLILPAKALTSFQVNKAVQAVGGPLNLQFYSTSIVTVGGYLGKWEIGSQTPPLTNLSPLANSQIVVFVFGLSRVSGAETYAVSIDPDFKILPPNTGSDKPRGWGRFISKPDVQPMLGEKIAWVGDSRFKNGNYNTIKRITIELGMTMMLTDANGRTDVAKSGRTMDKALYHADDTTEIAASEVQALTQVAIDFGYNDLFKTNPGIPTAANIAARIGSFTDAASGTVTPAGVASAATMCGKARTIIAWLLAQNPRLKITWSSTYYGNDPVGTLGLTQGQIEQWLLAWRDELERLCAVTGVSFHDWMKTSGINRYNYAAYLEDQIHMTDTPSDRNSATPSGYDLGMVSQWVQHYRAHGMPKRALAAYENVP